MPKVFGKQIGQVTRAPSRAGTSSPKVKGKKFNTLLVVVETTRLLLQRLLVMESNSQITPTVHAARVAEQTRVRETLLVSTFNQ